MKKLAFFPVAMVPQRSATPIAAAPLIVVALSDCSGVRRMRIEPTDATNRISPEGEEPGL